MRGIEALIQEPDGPRNAEGRQSVYPMTTEDVASYLDDLQVEGESCLCVAASGDQTISLLAAGAFRVAAFDRCGGAGVLLAYKAAALATLDRISFLELFSFTEGSDARLALHSKVAGAMGEGGRAAWRKAKTRWIRNDGAGKGREAWAPYLVDDAAYTRAGRIVAKAIGEGRVSFVRADLREIAHSDAAADCSVAVLSNVPEHMAARLSELAFRSGRPDPGPGAVGWADAKRRRLLDAHLGSVVPLLSRMPEGGRMMASYLYKAANLLGGDLDPARAAAVLGLKDAAGAAVSVRRCRHTLTSRGDAALLVVKKAEKGGEERRG